MRQLQKVFDYRDLQVRTVIIDGEAWFVAKDVCGVLEIRNNRDALNRLDDDEKGVALTDTLGGKQEMVIINEPGLYSLILGSRKKEAKEFKRWITHEVIPAVRKTGSYSVATPSYMIEDPIERAKQWIEEQQKIQLLEQRAAEYEEKANYVDQILLSTSTVTTTQIAKDYGMSARRLNQILKEEGVQFKQSGQWLLYSKYHHKGYTKSRTIDITHSDGRSDVRLNTHWTQKGRLFIHEVLKKRGHQALMDQQLKIV